MKHLLTIEEAQYGIRKATVLAKGDDDINRISICYNGIRGYINRGGAILCRHIEAEKIIDKQNEVVELMKRLFGDDFKGLYIAVTNDLYNPAKQNKRDAYYCH